MLRSASAFQVLLADVSRHIQDGNEGRASELLEQAIDAWPVLTMRTRDSEVEKHLEEFRDVVRGLISLLEQRRNYGRALRFARLACQVDPRLEPLVQRLNHLFVLHKSRPRALETLEHRLEMAASGLGSLLLISGMAGIGKTSLALVAEAWCQANGAAFALARAYERGMSPFLLWREVLNGLAEATGRDPAALPEPFGHAAPAESAHYLAREVTEWLHGAAATQPLVLLLDDIHWADQDSLHLLEIVTRHLVKASILIVATYRDDVLQREHPLIELLVTVQRNRPVETIGLQPLDVAGTRLLVDSRLGPCSQALAVYLHKRAAGHPLFLVELLADLTRRNLVRQDDLGEWLPPVGEVPLPAILKQLIAQRAAQLGQKAETFLSTAAVVGESWRLPVIEALLNWPETEILEVLEEALAARLLVEEDARSERYRFSHGLIREVLYYQQVARRRKRIHGQIAMLLEEEAAPDPAPVADHFFEAEEWGKSYRYSMEAGGLAYQRFAVHSALRFYYQALQSLSSTGATDTPKQLVSLYQQIGELHGLLNQRTQAAEAFKHMVEAARVAGDSQAEGRALFLHSLSLERSYQLAEATVTREAAVALAQALEDPHLLALNYYAFAFKYGVTGQPELARLYLDQAEEYARLLQDANLLADILRARGVGEIWDARYGKAQDSLSEAQSWARRSRNSYSQLSLYMWTGLARVESGHYQQARTTLVDGLSRAGKLDESHLVQLRMLNVLTYLYRELGDLEQARQLSQQAVEAGKHRASDDNIEGTCYALLELATTYVQEGNATAAAPYIREFEALSNRPTEYARFKYMNRYRLLQTELALALGQYKEALEQSGSGRTDAQAVELHKNVVKWRLYEGQALVGLGRADDALEPLKQAVALADEIGHGSLRWQTRLRLAQAQTTLRDPAATEMCQEALSLVTAIAGELTDPHLLACFLNSPLVVELNTLATATLPTTSESATEPLAGLTRREIEVIGLIAQGMTNQQIAEALTISVRTVNTHVTNILNKTGCDNRTAAAAFAIQHGLWHRQRIGNIA